MSACHRVYFVLSSVLSSLPPQVGEVKKGDFFNRRTASLVAVLSGGAAAKTFEGGDPRRRLCTGVSPLQNPLVGSSFSAPRCFSLASAMRTVLPVLLAHSIETRMAPEIQRVIAPPLSPSHLTPQVASLSDVRLLS